MSIRNDLAAGRNPLRIRVVIVRLRCASSREWSLRLRSPSTECPQQEVPRDRGLSAMPENARAPSSGRRTTRHVHANGMREPALPALHKLVLDTRRVFSERANTSTSPIVSSCIAKARCMCVRSTSHSAMSRHGDGK